MLLRSAIGKNIRKERIDQGLSIRALAGISFVSMGYLSEVERGIKEASSEMLNYICNGLDISLQELMVDVLSDLGKEASRRHMT
jgi:transcriptional regulator with XRE-family HTH domain